MGLQAPLRLRARAVDAARRLRAVPTEEGALVDDQHFDAVLQAGCMKR